MHSVPCFRYPSVEDFVKPAPASSNLLLTQAHEDSQKAVEANTAQSKKGLKFWFAFTSMCICLFLSALETCSVPTALPTIAMLYTHFNLGRHCLRSFRCCFHPIAGGLAQAYGRRPTLLITIGLFALGSGISGGANSMNVFIAGWTIQGLGGGGHSVTHEHYPCRSCHPERTWSLYWFMRTVRPRSWDLAGSIKLFAYIVHVVLLRPSVLPPGAALRSKDNDVGFSVSAISALRIPQILRQRARPQSSLIARCDLPFGSTHSSR
jgi:hypothetical protein